MGVSMPASIRKFIRKIIPKWSKNTVFIAVGVVIGMSGVALANPGNIVQKSLNLVGIETGSEHIAKPESTTQDNQDKASESSNPDASTNADGSDKTDDTTANSSPKPTGRDSGSTSIITPEEYQAHADNGETKLIQGTDWKVKINSQQPTSCGSQANPCPAGATATVNVSAYNVHTGELLPITECNGSYNKPYVGGDATPTSLPDANHCVLSFTPSSSGMYRLQIELYLSTTVYTDTIYWGGWVWGTDSPNSGGYFVN